MAKQKDEPKSIMKWDEQLAKEAAVAAGMEQNSGGGQFFSVKGGILTWNDAPVPGNQMAVIVLDHILENVFYEGDFDPDNPGGPACFAFGREEKDMAPHKIVVDAGTAVSEKCLGCPNNEWGSSDKGRGKACRNTRRLALIPAGAFNEAGKFVPIDDEDHFVSTPIGYMKLPVTSVKGFAGFVKQVASALRRPPHGVIAKVKVVPDQKTQFKMTFETISKVDDSLMGAIMKRRDEVKPVIDFPYQPREDDGAAKGKGKKGAAKNAKGRRY